MAEIPDFATGAEADFRARLFMKKVVDAMRPVLACKRGEGYMLPPGPCPSLRDVHDVVHRALGLHVSDVSYVSTSRLENGIVSLPPTVFHRTLADALSAKYGFRLMLELGQARFQKLRQQLGHETPRPLAEYLLDSLRLSRESLQAAVFHFWAAAFAKNEKVVDALAPLVTMMGRAVPIGEFVGGRGNWAVLVA